MKNVIILVIFLFFLVCCVDEGESNEDSLVTLNPIIIDQEPTEPLIQDGYTIEMLTYDDPLFEVEITNIVIDVIQRKIHFDYDIKGHSNMYRYYVVFGFETKEDRPFSPISTINFKPKNTLTKSLVYDKLNPTASMTIEIGRYRDGVHLFKDNPAANSAGFRYTIDRIEERHTVEKDYFYFYRNPEVENQAMMDFGINDPHHIIHSVKIMRYNVSDGGSYMDELVINVVPSMRIDGKIIIFQSVFDDLQEDEIYKASVYISGNDGVYDFNDVYLRTARTNHD